MKIITFFVAILLFALLTSIALVFGQTTTSAPPATTTSSSTKQNLGAPLIIADLSDGTDSFAASSPYDSQRSSSWGSTFMQAVRNFINNGGISAASVTFSSPNFIDTQGNFLNGVLEVEKAFNDASQYQSTAPPFVVISETATATLEILVTLREKLGSSSTVPIFITTTADEPVVRNAANIFRLNGNDAEVAGNFVDVLHALGQTSLCAIVDEDMDAFIFEFNLEANLASRPKGYPILLKTARVKSGARGFGSSEVAASDDQALLKLASEPNSCAAVLVVGEGNIAARILSARKRAATSSSFGTTAAATLSRMFFFFTPSTTARYPDVTANSLTNQALLTDANFRTVADLATQLSLTSDMTKDLTDTFGIMLSPVLDAISLAAIAATNSANKTNFLSSITSVTLTGGATTPFKISAATRTRSITDVRVKLLLLGSTQGAASVVATQTVASWVGSAQGSSPVVVSLPNTVPQQAAEPFVVCLVGQQSCPTLSALNHAYFTLLSSAPNVLTSSTSVFVKSISAGINGITTIGTLAAQVGSCDFAIGPGSSTTARNLYPFFNYHNVPMIDFSSTDGSLSNKISFNTYARVNPTDEYISHVAGSTFQNFGWSSVAIVTSLDNYGSQIVSAYTEGLAKMKVSVEASIMLPSNLLSDNATVYNALSKVKDELITRVIILAISANDDAHALFYKNIVDLDMTNTQIFWLSDAMCQYAGLNPSARYPLQNSMCASPQYDANAYREQYLNLYNTDSAAAHELFSTGGFHLNSCNLKSSDMYAPFASDAALTVLNVIKRLGTATNGDKTKLAAAQKNVTMMMDYIRSTHVTGITGIVAFDPTTGERTNAAYTVDMQQPNQQTVTFATWNSGTGYSQVDLASSLVWFNNGTEVPAYTTRDIKFIVIATVTRNTASVVFSILGFVLTIIIFCFLYKHYKLQKIVAGVQQQQQQKQGEGSTSVDMNQVTPQSQQQQQNNNNNGQYVNSELRQQGW